MTLLNEAGRTELRQVWMTAWAKAQSGRPLEPLEAVLAEVLGLHPEYHAALDDSAASLERDWPPEGGQQNPFLHMGLHVAVREAVATDRPPGIRAAFLHLAQLQPDPHAAEHLLIDCLAETLWEAQRDSHPPDEQAFLERARRRGRR